MEDYEFLKNKHNEQFMRRIVSIKTWKRPCVGYGEKKEKLSVI